MSIVCVCNNVAESVIVKNIKEYNVKSIKELQKHISVCNECGTCGKYIKFLIDNNNEQSEKNL